MAVWLPRLQSPSTVTVSACPLPRSAEAVRVPPTCAPSTLTVYCALPW